MAPRDFQTRLTRRAARAGLTLSDGLLAQLDTFHALLFRWNAKINLTALSDPDQVIERLFLEPLIAARFLPSGARRLMDVGSGGGSPAIPMKLAAPHVCLTMVEVKARKSAFLREAVRQLDLSNTTVETSRVEELLTRTDFYEAFDVVSVRAVRVEMRVLHTLQAFLVPGGQILLFRGPTGPEIPTALVPPLRMEGTYPLVDSLQSRLTIISKREH